MLNPIKTPMQLMMEQAGLPHYGGGGKTDILGQFTNRIQEAIRKYTKMTGKAPTPDEIRQLEEHIKGLAQPTPLPPQTMARTAQETPFASHLVDAYGRPYKPMVHPQTGRLTTPERAKGFTGPDQFGTSEVNMRAREKQYEPHANAFPEDEFLSMSNVGRLPSRTYQKSTMPSVEELTAKQAAAEMPEEGAGALSRVSGSYDINAPMSSASAPFAERAAALEAPGLGELRGQLSPALYPGKGGPEKSPYSATIERVKQEFRARGIEPTEEDILNAIHAEQNPLRHNYTGMNPIASRPEVDPRAGKVPQEMLDWRAQMRMSGQPEKTVTRSPSDWNPSSKRDYLLDTDPNSRASFAQDWDINDLRDTRRKDIPHRAMGGMMDNPRDMRAQLLAAGQRPTGVFPTIPGGQRPTGVFPTIPGGQVANPMPVGQPRPVFGGGQQPDGVHPLAPGNPQGMQFGQTNQTPQFGQASQNPQFNQASQPPADMLRKMFATQNVQHFGQGGVPKVDQRQINEEFARGPQFSNMADKTMYDMMKEREPKVQVYHPSPSERIASTGQDLLEKIGIRRPIARQASQTMFGGASSPLPGGMGVADLAAMANPAISTAMIPMTLANAGHNYAQGNYGSAAMDALGAIPAVRAIKRGFNP